MARSVQQILQRYNELQDIIAILGIDELGEENQVVVRRARRIERFLSQPMFVAEQFTGQPGVFTPLEETISSFKAIVEGEYDNLPEQAFFMCGGIEDIGARAARRVAGLGRVGRALRRPGREPDDVGVVAVDDHQVGGRERPLVLRPPVPAGDQPGDGARDQRHGDDHQPGALAPARELLGRA